MATRNDRALDEPDSVEELEESEIDRLSVRELQEELEETHRAKLDVDDVVRKEYKDLSAADQAEEVWQRYEYLIDWEKFLEKRLRERKREDFLMETEEDNEAVQALVAQVSSRFDDGLQRLKEQAGQSIRDGIDALHEQGKDVSVATRDRIYEALVDEEIIESWEPVEL